MRTNPRSAKWSWLAAVAMALCSAAGCGTGAPPPPDEAVRTTAQPFTNSLLADKLDAVVRRFMAHPRTAAVSVVVTRGDAILWSSARGIADPARGIPATEATPFYVAGVAKMIAATALMQLWEQGAFGLDDDVNGYLPFKVRNPAFPDAPITFRMLLGHGSSIGDNWNMIPFIWGADPEISLGRYLRDYFDPRTPGYDPALNWLPTAPGAAFSYSNIGFDLAGHLVERITKTPYDEYCWRHILRPLGMGGGFYLRDFGPGEIQPAVPSYYDGAARSFVSWGQYMVPLIASGTYMTDATSLARFLLMRINGGETAGYPRIISSEANALMHQPVFTDAYGLGLVLFPDYGWGPLTGHVGSDGFGVSSAAIYAESDHVGIVIMANGDVDTSPLFADLLDTVRAAN